jgi:uncharacterized protein YcaQ
VGVVRVLSIDQTRRLALTAQGLARNRPEGNVTQRHLQTVMQHVGLIQIDSVNVVARSHELVLFSRLGNHRRTLIADATTRGDLFEYWGHEAAHIPTAQHPFFRFRMQENKDGHWIQRVSKELESTRPQFLAEVLDKVRTEGPIVAGDISTRKTPKGPWWDWDHGKRALEVLFWRGEVTAYRRTRDFARVYDVVDRVLPSVVLDIPTPTEKESRKELLRIAAQSCGVATARDLADYHRQKPRECVHLVDELVRDGELEKVIVEGWRDDAYVVTSARIPRHVNARALLSPFDSLIWHRPRAERLFNFHYRLEIYTPAAKRKFGYYVLPFLLDEQLVGRVDVKADRQSGVLRVLGAFAEEGADVKRSARELANELHAMAQWLDLESVHVQRRGNLAYALRSVV